VGVHVHQRFSRAGDDQWRSVLAGKGEKPNTFFELGFVTARVEIITFVERPIAVESARVFLFAKRQWKKS
jgi:hypothetical protein